MFRTYQNALWQTQKLPKATDRKAKGEKKRNGPPTILTEQQVLECRSSHEFHRWNVNMCHAHYQTTVKYMRKLLNYELRGRLIPTPEDANLGGNYEQ